MALSTPFDDAGYSDAAKAPNPVHVAFAAAARAVASWHAGRSRRLALNDLLAMEPHRLRDLGIDVYEVREVLQRR